MKAKIKEKELAINLRRQGFSIGEIVEKIGTSQGSVSVWVRNADISEDGKSRLLKRMSLGRETAVKNKLEQTRKKEENYLRINKKFVGALKIGKDYEKLLCAAIYWCEGVKSVKYGLAFINSDPDLMKTFLRLLRNSFTIKEVKLRPLLHLHEYHDKTVEIDFWAKVTNIRKEQFLKPYIKPNGGKRKRDGYHGCLSLRYYNADIARQLISLGRAFLQKGA